METEYIKENIEPRVLSKFEEESLKDWFENNKEEYEISGDFKEWYESISWSRIDEIMNNYTNENE